MNINLDPELNQILFDSPFCIHKEAPKLGMLHSLLNNLHRPEIQQIYENVAPFWHAGEAPDKDFTKYEYMMWLERNLQKTAEAFVTYENQFMITFWLMFMEDENEESFNQEIRKMGKGQDARDIFSEKILYLAELGLLYLYGKDIDHLKAYLPTEFLEHILENAPSREMVAFADYCRVATNLYGVATASDITDLWNRDHGSHIASKDLVKHLEKCAQASKFFHYYNGGLTDYRIEFGDEITQIMDAQQGKPVYKPSREDIQHWAFAAMDINAYTPEYERLYKAIKKFVKPSAAVDAASHLLESCIRGNNPFKEIEFLRTEFGVEFNDIKEAETVLRPLQDFSNNCRMWVNLGHTPLSLPKPSSVKSPNSTCSTIVKNNVPKVGRNDPCPCGSGLKFKKCCGKNMS